MFDRIKKTLYDNGYVPDVIIDLGAYKGDWTANMMHIYPYCNYILFEANEHQELNYIKNLNNVKVYNQLLGNTDNAIVDWYQINGTGDSIFCELSHHYKGVEPVKKQTKTLNSFIQDIPGKNIFMKIDCQGSELPILEGANLLYDRIDFILMELPFFGKYNDNVGSFLDHISFMDKIGFIVYDIVEDHLVHNFNIQLDLIFINKKHKFNEKIQELHHIKPK